MIPHDRRGRGLGSLAGGAVLPLVLLGFAGADTPTPPPEFNKDVRPILQENCFACHGPDSAARKADLRLDKRANAVESGGIVPGDPDGSELVSRIYATDKTEVMPPPKSHKTLTEAQKGLLKAWIAAGAEYQAHWSFIPPKRTPPPAVTNEAWARNPIDRFVLARLEAEGLKPAPEADRRTLARRVSLDLNGLPPDPAEVDAFVKDEAPDAYEKLVDKLMASPRWGEHRGRYWLDAARYGDTHGIHIDNYREIWAYRESVIKAFNRNQPFDQFTVEQLAGDLLPNRTLEQQVASGFNRCNITTNEGGAINEEYVVLYARDRTETTSQVWMGLTTGCAVCHDHKFDPFSQKEFYELSAFFNNTTQNAMDGNVKDTPPVVFVPREADRPRSEALTVEVAAAKAAVEARTQGAKADFDQWLAGTSAEALAAMVPTDGQKFHEPLSSRDGSTPQPTPSTEFPAAGDLEKDKPFSYGAWVRLSPTGRSGAVFARMDNLHEHRGWDLWMENGKVGAHIINTWPSDALKVVSKAEIKSEEWHHLFVTYDASAKAAGTKIYIDGKPQPTGVQSDTLKNTIRTEVPLRIGQRQTSEKLEGVTVSDLRIFDRALSDGEVDRLAGGGRVVSLVAKPADQRTDAEKGELFTWWLSTVDPTARDLRAKVAVLEGEQAALKGRGTISHVMQEKGDPAQAFILFRGDYDKRRDQVKPRTPAALPPMAADLPVNRLGLARWLLTPEHPLTARVTVNRFWQELFGTGIVRTAGDFGVSGEAPSHPELLDWMAVEFREGGWDVKKFFKLLVTSAAYRQSAAVTREAIEKDPNNKLISRGPRFRMDAEMVRDYALAASGLLVEKLGGPSVRPYQPEGVWEAVAMPGSDTRDYRRDSGENLYRRSLYTFWKRSAPPASMDIFNAPSRETCTVRRERTNTPLQALVTLNDPQFVEAAKHLAQVALKSGGDSDEARLELVARRLLARSLRPEEASIVRTSLGALLAFYRAHDKEAAEVIAVGESKAEPTPDVPTLAAWTMLVNELMNLDEVLNK